MLQDMRRIQYITRRYKALQGLPLIIVGILLLFANVWRLWLVPSRLPFAGLLTFIIAFIVAIGLLGLTFIAIRYYQRNFGLVSSAPGDKGPILLKNGGFFILCFLGDSIDRNIHPVVSILALLLSAAFIIYWLLMERTQIYYLISALLLLIISVLPLFKLDVIFHTPVLTIGVDPYWAIVAVAIAAMFIVCGLLDHLLLVRSFSSLARGISIREQAE